MSKDILLGDEAAALGAVHAGLTGGVFVSRHARFGNHGISDTDVPRQDAV